VVGKRRAATGFLLHRAQIFHTHILRATRILSCGRPRCTRYARGIKGKKKEVAAGRILIKKIPRITALLHIYLFFIRPLVMQVMAHGVVHRHKNLSIQAICMQITRIKIKEASISNVMRSPLFARRWKFLFAAERVLSINYKVNLVGMGGRALQANYWKSPSERRLLHAGPAQIEFQYT
jgi:hypothetical protein